MPYIDRGVSRLYYEKHGDGPPIVLLHGVGGNHASWFHQVVAWREKATVITVDARGFGNSTDAEQWGRSAFVDDLAYLLDALALERVAIVAQSMGGGAAAAFSVRSSERVGALVLADTLVGFDLPDDIAARMRALAKSTDGLTQLQRVLGPTFLRAQPVQSYLYTALASFNDTNVRTLRGVQETVSPAALGASKVPVLFVVGVEDVLFPPQEIHAVQSLTEGSEYLEIAAAGHSAYFEQPEMFNREVYGWLARQMKWV